MDLYEEFLKRGFAEGHYMNSCSDCNNVFVGDKRAWTCFKCAVKKIQEDLNIIT